MKTRLWLLVLLLLVAFFVRAHQINALPPFNDESHHIRRAEMVWSFQDADLSFTVGKLLTYYWLGIFHPERLDAVHVARSATALFALLGLAAAYALGRWMFGAWAGLLAVYMLTFAPFMVFFDRMALADPLTTALGMLTVWAGVLLVRRPSEWEWGLLAGILVALTILAKLTGFPFALVPLWGILIFAEGTWRARWRRYRTTLLVCYGVAGGILMPFLLRVVYEELFGERISVIDMHLINHQSQSATLWHNIGHLWEALATMHHPLLVGVFVLALLVALWRRSRAVWFVLGCVALAWGSTIILSGVISTRYLQLGVPLFFVLGAGALFQVPLSPSGRLWLGWGVASVWIVFFAQPFILNAWNNPIQNHAHLTDRSRWEYFTNFTAGYGLMDAARVMPTLQPSMTSDTVPIIGIVGSCHQIRLYLEEPSAVFLECPAFGWEGEFMDDVANYVDFRLTQESVLYMLVEPQLPYTDLSKLHVQHEVIGRFERPLNGMVVELWRVYDRVAPS